MLQVEAEAAAFGEGLTQKLAGQNLRFATRPLQRQEEEEPPEKYSPGKAQGTRQHRAVPSVCAQAVSISRATLGLHPPAGSKV